MPIWNKISAALAVSALFAAPAFADGTPGKRVNHGPAPLQAHAMTPPEPGCVLVEGGKAWACPVPQARFTHQPTSHRSTTRTTSSHGTHYGHRTNDHGSAHGHSHTSSHGADHGHTHGATTRTHTTRSAPTTTRRTVSTRTVAPTTTHRVVSSSSSSHRVVDTGVKLDVASFSGGVGNGVDGGFYGGGGGIFIGGGKSYSGVLSHAASQFTFRQRGGKKRGHGGKRGGHHGGGGGGCGC
jgi:hypothetical protein